jgi:hypothetical protein
MDARHMLRCAYPSGTITTAPLDHSVRIVAFAMSMARIVSQSREIYFRCHYLLYYYYIRVGTYHSSDLVHVPLFSTPAIFLPVFNPRLALFLSVRGLPRLDAAAPFPMLGLGHSAVLV